MIGSMLRCCCASLFGFQVLPTRHRLEQARCHYQRRGDPRRRYGAAEDRPGLRPAAAATSADCRARVCAVWKRGNCPGITLTAADTVVFYGPLMSVEQYIQCCARADRKGQTSDKVTVVHIQGSAIEKRMFKALEGKVSDNTLLTEMFDQEIN